MTTFESRLILRLARRLMAEGKAKWWSEALVMASKQVMGG
jgi:hypothetical protein